MNGREEKMVRETVNDRLASMQCVHSSEDERRIRFYDRVCQAAVSFYDGDIIELSVQERKTENFLFYLHFQMTDPQMTEENIRIFFECFEHPYRKQERLDVSAAEETKGLKILISCTSGFTSSFFASLMQEALDREGSDAKVDAVGSLELDQVQEQYDYILLAPQIAYMLEEFQNRYGKERVMLIRTTDFSVRNANGVINWLLQMHRGNAA